MNGKSLEEKGYKLIIEDSELEIRSDPKEQQGYVLFFKRILNSALYLPRGTLEEIARADRNRGNQIIEGLQPLLEDFFVKSKLTYDSINAIITKAYLKEQENYQNWLRKEKTKD
ncbi:MAG: hypothetical protein WC812_04475 [Candidatus Pacearchaeota archaeon]|jgi:hypothetical protein